MTKFARLSDAKTWLQSPSHLYQRGGMPLARWLRLNEKSLKL
jgi:hypothetical protein